MTKKTKTIWLSVVGVIVLGLVASVVILWSDGAEPDVSDIWPEQEVIPNNENALYFWGLFPAKEYRGSDDAERLAISEMAKGTQWDDELARRVVEKNGALYKLVEKAANCDVAMCPEPRDLYASRFSHGGIGFVDLCRVRARLLFKEGRQEEALEEAMRIVRIGCLIKESWGGTWIFSVGRRIHEEGDALVRDFLKDTSLPPEVLKKCIEPLLSYSDNKESCIRACRAEFADYYLMVSDVASIKRRIPKQKGIPKSYLFRPNQTKRLLAESCRYLVKRRKGREFLCDISGTNPPKVLTTKKRSRYELNSVGKQVVYNVGVIYSGLEEYTWRLRAEYLATALLVALKCYKLEHGELPDSLEDLVPKYLDEVPRDPYDGKPYKYSRDKKILWAVKLALTDYNDFELNEVWEKILDARSLEPDEGCDLITEIEF